MNGMTKMISLSTWEGGTQTKNEAHRSSPRKGKGPFKCQSKLDM